MPNGRSGETGFGKVEDKIDKNLGGSIRIYEAYCDRPIGGIRQDRDRNIVEIGRPAGVIVGLSNSTSPVGTVYFKAMLALMTRNAIVFSPHPAALACTADAARFLEKTARLAGAPADAIQILAEPTLKATNALMQADESDLVIATGGAAMVRAAYSSGNPALGVGPGNTPVYVDRSADLASAAEKIVAGKEYDYGTPCSAPSVVLADRPVARDLRGLLEREGAWFCSDEELATLEAAAFPGGRLNPAIIGQPAGRVAQIAGLSLPPRNPRHRRPAERCGPGCGPGCGERAADGARKALRPARRRGRGRRGRRHRHRALHAALGRQRPYRRDLHRRPRSRPCCSAPRSTITASSSTAIRPTAPSAAARPCRVTFTIGTGFAGKSSIDHNLGPGGPDRLEAGRLSCGRNAGPRSRLNLGPNPQAESRAEPARGTDATVQALKEEIRRIVAEELARS